MVQTKVDVDQRLDQVPLTDFVAGSIPVNDKLWNIPLSDCSNSDCQKAERPTEYANR